MTATVGREAPLPDLPVYMSRWRAALLLVVTLPFLLCAAVLARSLLGYAPPPGWALGAALLFGTAMGLLPLVWVIRYRRSRGPLYVFRADGLVVGRFFGGTPIPWQDVWISWPWVMSGPLITTIDYRRPEFRSDPARAGGPAGIYRDKHRHMTMRRIVMPNISTLGNRGLDRMLVRYAVAAGVRLEGLT